MSPWKGLEEKQSGVSGESLRACEECVGPAPDQLNQCLQFGGGGAGLHGMDCGILVP